MGRTKAAPSRSREAGHSWTLDDVVADLNYVPKKSRPRRSLAANLNGHSYKVLSPNEGEENAGKIWIGETNNVIGDYTECVAEVCQRAGEDGLILHLDDRNDVVVRITTDSKFLEGEFYFFIIFYYGVFPL